MPLQVCWKCLATKGSNGNLGMCYTDISEGAEWRGTLYSTVPWEDAPPFSLLPGFNLRMIGVDILHAWHLGVCRDLIGSVLRVLSKLKIFRRGGNLEDQLSAASSSLRNFAKSRRLSLNLRRLSKSNLNWRSDAYPEAHCKGYDSYIILLWLDWFLHKGAVQEVQDKVPAQIKTVVWAANSMMSVWVGSPMFMSDGQRLHIHIIGQLFIRVYVELAAQALQDGVRLWRIRPKLHLLHHLILEQQVTQINAHYFSTWMDEDNVKNIMRVKKRTHKLQASDRSIKRWLLGLRPKLDSVMAKLLKK